MPPEAPANLRPGLVVASEGSQDVKVGHGPDEGQAGFVPLCAEVFLSPGLMSVGSGEKDTSQ
ncbi:hypothetical protein GCM10022252_25370 [Streptosporangium oxazolinicum]|uniref:Uncharacterized protein n=1 Tax=Streptosporangium oxazolinicum TaxID=909287 RepID=A0ABP8ARY6_9ACTN